MSAVDTPQKSGGGRHKKKHKQKRRLGVRIDMTPMVDVAWLLLTFFILTTTFSKPQAMEINLPPDNKVKVEMAESNLLTIRVNERGEIFQNYGMEKPQRITMDQLEKFFAEQVKEKPKVTVMLKVARKTPYHFTVDILDDLGLAKINRFSLQPLSDEDQQILSKV